MSGTSGIRSRTERLQGRRKDFYPNANEVYNADLKLDIADCDDCVVKEYYPTTLVMSQNKTKNFYKYLRTREIHGVCSSVSGETGIRRMIQNKLYKEHPLSLKTDKVFCSTWLTDSNIAMGTKCNKLLVYNVLSRKIFEIPSLKSSSMCPRVAEECGIHSIKINPSKNLLVTGGPHSNDVAIYKLPSFKPLCVGEGAHKDWIFDFEWLDDEWFVSGGRDGDIALWHINPDKISLSEDLCYYYIKPIAVKQCLFADKVRALHFQPLSKLTALSTNSILHVWDLQQFQQLSSRRLPHRNENVCLTYNSRGIYAVGSSSHVTFFDSSMNLHVIQKVKTVGHGVRSLCFHGDILTIGTGSGKLQFYDLAAGKMFKGSDCKISPTPEMENRPAWSTIALYTHCYNSTGTSLFVGGGPLSMMDSGCYAALWH